MKIVHYTDVDPTPVTAEGACGTTIRWLVSRDDGAKNFAMRLFELGPGGHTPLHEHAWEHEAYIVKGPVQVVTDSGSEEANAGDAV